MATGWLKNAVINAGAPKITLISKLRKNMAGWHPARSIETVHASDVTKPNFCPRQWALLDLAGKEKKDEYIATALRATFDLGNLTADHLVEEWAGDMAIGHWKCASCQAVKQFCEKPKKGCGKMGITCQWKYVEVKFESQEYRVSGSIDLIADLDAPKYAITELKIIKGEEFDKMVAPLPEHRIRTSLYMKLVSDSDSPYKDRINLHEARVLYVSRGYGKKHDEYNGDILPFKEYVVKRDDEITKPYLMRAIQLKVFREDGKMPSGICSLPTDKCAKGCNRIAECFSGKFPAEQPPLD